MKKINFVLLAVMALFLGSCNAGISYVAEEVRNEMETQLEEQLGFNVTVDELFLVHAGGNKYESVVNVRGNGETAQFEVDVPYDGKYWQAKWAPILY